ncbi:replication protein A 70 kDa DNA-binding subunit-like [Harmonia axyridis]|uniref:replication protein A 70 kDa DNA-binding subunit-like n=1 Tax=Harmonia axyridis TaxID=115357 RepID=UPI001E277D7E|nr:replication protein A 70 kDa DNA-binding subunit-like [Harmonia axyridis]
MINVADWSGNSWLSMFTTEAETILGMPAQEIGDAIENNSEAAAGIVERVNFKQFIFKCRAKMETYNDEARLKTIAVEVKTIDYKDLNNQVIKRIKQLMG